VTGLTMTGDRGRTITFFTAPVRVIAVQPGSCRFVWAIDVLPDELGARVGQLMDAGLAAIKATLEES
jgi:hypothetical protein